MNMKRRTFLGSLAALFGASKVIEDEPSIEEMISRNVIGKELTERTPSVRISGVPSLDRVPGVFASIERMHGERDEAYRKRVAADLLSRDPIAQAMIESRALSMRQVKV